MAMDMQAKAGDPKAPGAPAHARVNDDRNVPEHQGGEKTPKRVFSYLVGNEAYVQASVWERQAQRQDGTMFTTFDVSVRKRFRDTPEGEWKSLYTFHASEAYVVAHALTMAAAYAAELRAGEPDA